MPRLFFDISTKPSLSVFFGSIIGILSPTCIISSTVNSKRLPKEPLGCEIAKSLDEKFRHSVNVAANASPIAKLAVVLAVGAKLRGHASL